MIIRGLRHCHRIAALSAACTALASAEPENLLRNGSFEGGTLYWHQVAAPEQTLVKDGKVGDYALRIAKGNVMSAPFVAERGRDFTVSLWVRGEQPGKVAVQMPPSAREVGTKSKRLWMRESEQSADITTEWKRVSFTWPADVPQDGFWPQPHYLLQIGGCDEPILIDGVTVTKGREGTPDYVPRRAAEVVAECTNLPGYAGAAGNLFEKGATAAMAAHVSNPGSAAREVTVRWQLVDYEGEQTLGAPVEKRITLGAGKTIAETTPLKLTHTGMVLARLSVLDENGALLDKSDFPLTSLPYPKAAPKPDSRERFGGSFAGGTQMIQKLQRIGFGWTRWYPETKWHNFQKQAGAPFDWHDDSFATAQSHGLSQHVVLYGWPPGLMDKEHSGQPLPLDMQWPADDPRWEDPSIETAWDKYVRAAVRNFRGQSVVFEIENEPEFDQWEQHQPEYARFTIRTARLIKQTDPKAQVMVNNSYGIPSALNAALFRVKDGLKHVDVVSWHDYHAGWLSDAQGIRRMRQNLDEAGGKHVEIWFNEGWAFTNTAVDEPIACTHLTAAQSTNAHACSVAEMTVAGQEKTILFHTGYEQHGMSFWDYSGPGTCLWDWYGNPLPLVGMWNVLNHHIGTSDEVGFVRPPGANLCIFQDRRNGRGVVIAYADREAKEDAVVDTSALSGGSGGSLIAEDIMGNTAPAPKTLMLAKSGRPVLLYAAAKTPGTTFLAALEALDRKHAGFVTQGGAAPRWNLPAAWEGTAKGKSTGNPIAAADRPVWRLDRLFPEDALMAANYSPMIWDGTKWAAPDRTHAGHPSATVENGNINLAAMGPWNGGDLNFAKVPALAFIAPAGGLYQIRGTARAKPWEGGAETYPLSFRKKDTQRTAELRSLQLPRDGRPVPFTVAAELAAGHELLVVPMLRGLHHNAVNIEIDDLAVTRDETTRRE